MAAITAELEIDRVQELIQRRRIARTIAVGSAFLSALIATVGSMLAVAA